MNGEYQFLIQKDLATRSGCDVKNRSALAVLDSQQLLRKIEPVGQHLLHQLGGTFAAHEICSVVPVPSSFGTIILHVSIAKAGDARLISILWKAGDD